MFEPTHEDKGARAGKLKTAHGTVKTPCFMPVATKGSVKTLSSGELLDIDVQAFISNAFVLYLKPGVNVIEKAGGLHSFMNWERTIFTDSGGFQILKEEFAPEVKDKGVTFRSPFDETKHLLTPEKCVEVQESLGSDVAMVLDDCPPYGSDRDRMKSSVERTTDWAKRSRDAHKKENQLLFAIVQGGTFQDLREKSAGGLVEIGFDGYGIGGLSIGEPKEKMLEVLEYTLPLLPKDRPRYLMGVGSPVELIRSISLGTDIFDSAFPTRNARHNSVYTCHGSYNITRGKYKHDFSPLEKDCSCYACVNYTKSYIRHLMVVYEMLGMRLITIHNLHFLRQLMKKARDAILENRFSKFESEFSKMQTG
jgi:queuine tRNA-ribosyltransferase